MRVLHVDTARGWRGGQTQLLHLARRMPGCTVACRADGALRPALEAAGVSVVPIAFVGSLWGWRELARVAADLAPEVVAAHDAHAHVHALRAGGRPVVVFRRVDFAPNRWSRRRYRAVDRFVAVSDAVRRVLVAAGVDGERVDVVCDGVDPAPLDAASADPAGLRAELGLAPSARVALAVGALVDHKAHDVLVDALAALPGWTAVIAGEGPLRQALLDRATRRGVAGRLRLVGARSDVPRLLKSVDVVVHPSRLEGLGQVVVEARIAGARLVVTRAGGAPEAAGRWATVVGPDDPVALAAAIRDARTPPDADAAEARARFSVDAMVEGSLRALACAARERGAAP